MASSNEQNAAWAAWITDRYYEWRMGKIGNSASITEFAKQFNASHQVVLGWMKGSVPKTEKYISALERVYGPAVYDALGLARPVPLRLDPNQSPMRESIAAFKEAGALIAKKGISADSPEAVEIFIEVFSRFGFKSSSTDKPSE